MAISNEFRGELQRAFREGTLLIQSVSPYGSVEWKPIMGVHRASVPWDSLVEIRSQAGSMILTGGHRVYTGPTTKVEAEKLQVGQQVLAVVDPPESATVVVESVQHLPPRQFMYDITVADWHNFKVVGTNIVVSNSPDRNYRFRPPEGEGQVGCYNRVFGYIWEDAELAEYLEIALWKWNVHPPETSELGTIDQLCASKPAWKSALLWGALVNAAQALAYNWISEEFSYSIGGISLDLEKSSKYMDLKRNAEEQWDKLVESKKLTTLYMRGIQQPRMGIGVRSAFGPNLGRGVLGPRRFL